MLPQFSPIELMVVAIVALVVVGPRDLPKIARAIGGFVRQAQGLAREFRRSFDDMGREIELDELRKEVQALKSGGPLGEIKKEFQSVGDEMKSLDKDVREAAAASKAESDAVSELGKPAEQPKIEGAAKPVGAVAGEKLAAIKEPAAPASPHAVEPTIHDPSTAPATAVETPPTSEPEAAPTPEQPAKRVESGRG